MIKKFFYVFVFFLFIFGIPFTFIPINSSKVIIVFLILWATSCRLYKRNFFPQVLVNDPLVYMLTLLYLLFFLAILYPTLHQTYDFSIAYAYLIMFVEPFLGGYLFYALILKNYSFDDVLKLFICIAFIQACIILLMLMSESFREIVFLISKLDSKELMERYGGFRGFGLAGSVTYDLSVFLAINLIFIAYLLSKKSITSSLYIIIYFVIFIASLMTGRSAWIGVVLSFGIVFWNFRSYFILLRVLQWCVLSIVICSCALLLSQSFFPSIYLIFTDTIVPYAFEAFINLYDTGKMTTTSSDILQGMYFPIKESTFLIGDGYYVDSNKPNTYYMGTDAGYMRQILFYGFFPSVLLYSFYLFGFYIMYKAMANFKSSFVLFLSLACYFFVMQYKGAFLTGSAMNIKIFFILLIYCQLSSNLKKNRDCK